MTGLHSDYAALPAAVFRVFHGSNRDSQQC